MNRKTGDFLYIILSLMVIAGAAVFFHGTECQAAKKALPRKIKLQGEAAKGGICLKTGENKKITYKISPRNASGQKVTFSSSNKKIAKVTKKGCYKRSERGKSDGYRPCEGEEVCQGESKSDRSGGRD